MSLRVHNIAMPLSEADTRAKLIDPTLFLRGWTEDHIKREETAGAITINPKTGQAQKAAKGRIDYTLRLKINTDSQPVAVALIEAKAEDKLPNIGLEQAKKYANLLNVPFVFCSNGRQYFEYDHFTGQTKGPISLDLFPAPQELQKRYETGKGFALESPAARPLLTRYSRGEATRRYYQDAAIRAVFEKLARCEIENQPRRALLSLATGAGKTFLAVALLKRIADAYADRKFRALFICDRDELRIQAAAAFQNEFGSNAAIVSGNNPQKNAKLLIATYQTLDIASEEDTANFLTTNYPENYFTHIVIDECHRSAWGKWSQVLKQNSAATQIGLTATPRQFDHNTPNTKEAKADAQVTADNYEHFGEPVYEYDMVQGMADGYLAACVVQEGRVNLDDTGITIDQLIARGAKDARTGELMTREQLKALYDRTEFEARVQLPDRVQAMCADLFQYFLDTGGPEQKTIIFCASDYHADAVAMTMNNIYASWFLHHHPSKISTYDSLQAPIRANPYAFKCTAKVGGAQYIADLKGASRSHFIATTVDLLSTGVDIPPLKNVVFFRYLTSPITFYQMVGRGTRLDPATGKLMFTLYDYTGVTKLFGKKFITEPPREKTKGEGPRESPPVILVDGFNVEVTPGGRLILSKKEGKDALITIEEYKEQLAAELVHLAPTLDNFRTIWISPKDRRDLLTSLPEAGRSVLLIQSLADMLDYDPYDVLADLGYGLAPRTRPDRADAFLYKHAHWLSRMPTHAATTVQAIASQFAKAGTDGLENPQIFRTPEVTQAGGLQALQQLGDPATVLRETKRRMFTA